MLGRNSIHLVFDVLFTHAHTKCPPVFSLTQSMKGSLMRSMGRPSFPGDSLFWNVSMIVLHSSVVIRPSHDCLCSSDTLGIFKLSLEMPLRTVGDFWLQV